MGQGWSLAILAQTYLQQRRFQKATGLLPLRIGGGAGHRQTGTAKHSPWHCCIKRSGIFGTANPSETLDERRVAQAIALAAGDRFA
jgi:hypothetical protein